METTVHACVTAVLNFSLEARPPAPAPRKRPCTDTQSEYSTHIYLTRLTFRLTPVCDCLFVIPIYRDRTLTKLVATNVRSTQLDVCRWTRTKNAAGRLSVLWCLVAACGTRQVHLAGFIRALCDYEPQAQCALVNTWSRHVNFNHGQLLEPREMFKTSVI